MQVAAPTPNGTRSRGRHETGLPHNADAEASILGGILIRNEVLAELEDLEPDAFFDQRNAIVFRAMRELQAAGRPIDVVTVELEIERFDRTYETHKLEAIGGVAYLGQLALRVPTADNVVAYANTVKLLHRHRQALVALSTALERARTWPHEPEELISEVAGELQRIEADHVSTTRAKKARWTVPIIEYLGDTEPDDDDSEDWIIRDLIPRGEPFMWGGPMKSGKTWAALDLCIAIATGSSWLEFENTLRRPARVLGIFREDNKRRLHKRLWELTRPRGITPHHAAIVENLRISRESLRLPDARDQRRFVDEIKAFGADFVLIDNLTRVMVGDANSTRDAAAFTQAWTLVGDETGASVGFLHHTRKPMGDQKAIDPFETLRGSGDFGATARNVIITTPLRSETEKLSEVRMRGNLDLRREGFTLAFERVRLLDRWHARLVDRGEIDQVREEVKGAAKEAKEARKKAEFEAETQRRRAKAVEIASKNGSITARQLANEFGLASERGKIAETLNDLVREGVLVQVGRKGYELASANRQEGLL